MAKVKKELLESEITKTREEISKRGYTVHSMPSKSTRKRLYICKNGDVVTRIMFQYVPDVLSLKIEHRLLKAAWYIVQKYTLEEAKNVLFSIKDGSLIEEESNYKRRRQDNKLSKIFKEQLSKIQVVNNLTVEGDADEFQKNKDNPDHTFIISPEEIMEIIQKEKEKENQ